MTARHRTDRVDLSPPTSVLKPGLRAVLLCATAALISLLAPCQVWSGNEVSKPDAGPTGILRVMTLNVAHGRGTSFHQVLLDRERISGNLDAVAAVAEREDPDVLALQEADARSGWSGRFNHISYLAEQTGLLHRFQGRHVHSFGLEYGTALLANGPLHDAVSRRFSPSLITPPKGFVVASVEWPGDPGILVDVVSVHLEFFRDAVQFRQAAELAALLKSRANPLVVMGDLNVEWDDSDGVLPYLVRTLGLQAYAVSDDGLITLPRFNRRVDWILASSDFAFVSYRVLPDPLSDHRAVVAELKLVPKAEAVAPRISQLH